MEMLTHSLAGIGPFFTYLVIGLALIAVFKVIYSAITPYDEWGLVKESQNQAAAIGIGGALVGFTLALAAAASNSVSVTDYLLWAGVALLAQLLAFTAVRFVILPGLVEKIEQNNVAAAIVLAAINISVGLLNAACMSY
ncbi:DUF350 domain-containing protein [Ferrimonas sp. SCSIO 43195]|uniref:DUF350 domain-containing protein n=1 Tax=Ferrimonas sp. SCSIO 43195 TaxID=2822844 RepID=UPI00207637BF|nr:DUF350 domain-containing protein [Ferrimonas sp. SCSIO 43195]USD39280.1 DUF350 domain-containing protein [Ferrimonas sp. SCSIO 43195]